MILFLWGTTMAMSILKNPEITRTRDQNILQSSSQEIKNITQNSSPLKHHLGKTWKYHTKWFKYDNIMQSSNKNGMTWLTFHFFCSQMMRTHHTEWFNFLCNQKTNRTIHEYMTNSKHWHNVSWRFFKTRREYHAVPFFLW